MALRFGYPSDLVSLDMRAANRSACRCAQTQVRAQVDVTTPQRQGCKGKGLMLIKWVMNSINFQIFAPLVGRAPPFLKSWIRPWTTLLYEYH